MTKFSLWTLGLLLFAALARDLIANERPLWCRVQKESFFPALRAAFRWGEGRDYSGTALETIESQRLWNTASLESALFPPVPFQPGEGLGNERLLPPGSASAHFGGRMRNWLGTDDQGRDVAASMVSGARIAVLTGLVAMGMALSIGLILGVLAGYFGDDRLRVRRGRLWATLAALPVAWFYAFPARMAALQAGGGANELAISTAVFLSILLIFNLLGVWISRVPMLSKKVLLAADLIIMRLAELFNAIRKLLVIVAVSALAVNKSQSTLLLLALIGVMSWPSVARFVRAELLKVREMEFMLAARGLGLSDARIMLRHALPNALRAVTIAFALGVAGAILLEASLSLLGYGASAGREVSWGILLNTANANRQCWWLVVPPGLAICLVVLALNRVGEDFSDR